MTALLFAVVGAEVLVVVTWWPETLRIWFDPDTNGYGDFPLFYRNARSFSLNAFYSPGLAVLMHPLTYLSMRAAFAVYLGVNVVALAGIAFLAQRGVTSSSAKLAVALAIFALPQTHWALRVGHFTEVLALAALAGFLLCDRRPVLAGLCFAVLALKPQYLPVPLLYLLFTRNWRAFGAATGTLLVLGVAGVAAAALRDPAGLGMFGYTLGYYGDRFPEAAQFLTFGQRDQLYPQGWQYSWYGFLVSAGIEPNPLLAGELFALSLGAMLLAWWRCSPSVAKVAAALGMLLLTPHTSFYNWSMLAVAAALLLRSDLKPRVLVPLLLGGMAIAAAATQANTPFPLPRDIYRPAGTLGLYWITPAALAVVCLLAILGRPWRTEVENAAGSAVPLPPARASLLLPRARAFDLLRMGQPQTAAVAAVAVAAGLFVAAFVTNSGPFASDTYFGRGPVLAALPADFPLPPDAALADAGAGERLPYRIEWQSGAPVSEVAGIMRTRLDDGSWRVVDATVGDGGEVFVRSTRSDPTALPVLAEIRIVPDGEESAVRLEFTPLPASSVPGYDEWLRGIGLVVHNIDPDSPAARVTPSH